MIGSQAILGTHEDAPDVMLESMEADMYPLADPGETDRIDGALGDGSQFHLAFGYYAHGVGPETVKAPGGWRERLVRRDVPQRVGSTRQVVAWCLDVHDLVLSKCAAGRHRDWDYAAAAIRAEVVDLDVLLARVPDMPLDAATREHVARTLRALS